jgi:hypothetical protein
VKSGCSFAPTFSGGFLPLQDGLLAGVLGMSVVEASGSLLSGDAMAAGHLVRPARSAGKKHVGATGVLLLVPFKTFEDSSSGGWSASTPLFQPPALRMTGRSLQRSECNFLFFRGCRCKRWVVNHQEYL